MPILPEAALNELRAACADAETYERVKAVVERLMIERERRDDGAPQVEVILRTLIDSYPGGVVSVFDMQMRHVLVGGEAGPLHRFDPARMIGKTPSEFRAGEPAAQLETQIRRTLLGETVRGLQYDDGRTTLVISTPINDGDGQAIGAIVIGQDVTDLVQLQEEKFKEERARAVLEQEVAASRARAAIIERVLHQVRNPLASLSSSVEMLERYNDRMSEEKQADHLRRIYLEVRALAEALSQLAQTTD